MRILLVSVALVLAGCVAKPPPAAPDKAVQTAANGERKVCRETGQLGSLQTKRTCATQAEWDEADRRSKEGSDQFNRIRRAGGAGEPSVDE